MKRIPRTAWIAASLLAIVLIALGSRYGFHRDELYFIEGGRHLAWAQPDNPILIPLLANAWHQAVGGQLWAFRILPALAAASTVLVASLTSRQLGGTRRQQSAAAIVTAVTGVIVGTGHLFSITTFDIFLTALVLMLLARALRQPQRLGAWVLVGLAAGVALEVKLLAGAVLACCVLAMLLVGLRRVFASSGPWIAAGIAAALAAPNLIWQTVHGWPMRDVAANIAEGGSTSSADSALILPMHLLIAGAVTGFVVVLGMIVLIGAPRFRPWRWVPVAYLLLLTIVIVAGGKPYYMAGMFPIVVAAGTIPLMDWIDRTAARRRLAPALAVLLSIPTAFFSLPLAPIGSPVFEIAAAVNPDAKETVGWGDYVTTVSDAAEDIPDSRRSNTIVLTDNYGEAGALDRARRMGIEGWIPPIYSGHNAYGTWGPPPHDVDTVVLVGDFDSSQIHNWFRTCENVASIEAPRDIDNEENGAAVRVCQADPGALVGVWPQVQHFG